MLQPAQDHILAPQGQQLDLAPLAAWMEGSRTRQKGTGLKPVASQPLSQNKVPREALPSRFPQGPLRD